MSGANVDQAQPMNGADAHAGVPDEQSTDTSPLWSRADMRPDADTQPVQPSPGDAFDFDVTIVGAGPVGLALAGWLARRSATRALSVALIDAREPESAAS